MPSKKKTGMAYIICGVIIIILTLITNLVGWKLIMGIVAGAALTLVGLLLSSKKAQQ